MTPVLDACCGTRMFWFDRQDPRATYMDIREEQTLVVDKGTPGTKGRKPKVLKPDIVADFRCLPFDDNSFWHVVFDPPHLGRMAGNGTIAFVYGKLADSWRDDIKKGFAECFRVLKPNGTLVFKWNEVETPLSDVLALTNEKPLYGHRSGKKAQTHWVAFIKGGNQNA
jgi:ubiquinone/menaquinone biosynthesis C-methylase UbiE